MRYVDRCGLAAEQCKVPEAGRAGRGGRASSGPRPREQAERNKSERGEWKNGAPPERPAGESPAGETPAVEAVRRSCVKGKSVSVRVVLGVRGSIKNKIKKTR